ncbi:adenylate/guanylate cyclase domain-containing protein [Streptomyces alboflavus]|uniref:adenylate/guanylate cyclase domain-containing protein n=1 Tax=Streptomyces alboflavus TaxID=67267 RepID=UPI000F658546|nr:adenylate/guanylate cyclase domain-containing protein [Streptomyces alboflavus]
MTDPVSRTLLLLDIERYSDRDDVEQAYLRRMLYDITDRTLDNAGIHERLRLRADRGDSVMELVDATASVIALLRALLQEMPMRLRAVNRMASSSAQIRLRAVLATGYVAIDDLDGWVGSDLNQACRLLDAEVLRASLRERADDFVLCVSSDVYNGIVRHDHAGVPARDFHPVTVDSKNGPIDAWLHGPPPGGGTDRGSSPTVRPASETQLTPPSKPDTPQGRPSEEPPPDVGAVFNFHGGAPTFGGSLVGGDQHVVSGGQVSGDVYLGGSSAPAPGPAAPERGEHA